MDLHMSGALADRFCEWRVGLSGSAASKCLVLVLVSWRAFYDQKRGP